MAIAVNQLLTWSRIAANRRAAVTDKLFPGGLADLNDYTAEEIKDAVKNFRMFIYVERLQSRDLANKRGSRFCLVPC